MLENAERDYLSGMKYKDIAEKYGVSINTVKSWIKRHGWSQKKGAPSEKGVHPNRVGAPQGNKNAKGNRGGHGGPVGNKKAVRTGEYESIWMDMLADDEQSLLDEIDTDPVAQADEAITLFSIRERRMLGRIKKLSEGLTEKQRRELQQLRTQKEAVPLRDEKTGKTNTVVKSKEELIVVEIEETSYRAIEDILRIEEALTRVQAQKLRAIELKNRLTAEDEEKKVRTAILQIELQQLQGGAGATQSWTDALKEIAERRKARRAAEVSVDG